jgi:hypothetical protein
MIDLILKMLELNAHYGVSRNIDIAKGINKTPLTIKEGLEQIKRRKAWR